MRYRLSLERWPSEEEIVIIEDDHVMMPRFELFEDAECPPPYLSRPCALEEVMIAWGRKAVVWIPSGAVPVLAERTRGGDPDIVYPVVDAEVLIVQKVDM